MRMRFSAKVPPVNRYSSKKYAIMKPGKRDIKVSILITGQELDELQKHTWSMAESFGLDRRIDNYMTK